MHYIIISRHVNQSQINHVFRVYVNRVNNAAVRPLPSFPIR